jgi:hypothetical protein
MEVPSLKTSLSVHVLFVVRDMDVLCIYFYSSPKRCLKESIISFIGV